MVNMNDDTLERGDELPMWEYPTEDLWTAPPLVGSNDLRDLADRLERLIKEDAFTIQDNGGGYGESKPALVFKVVDAMRKAAYQMEMKL
jgi:3-deoxy-D-arabino-heptulosonate 7-phosphate (DAHP) synthase class II